MRRLSSITEGLIGQPMFKLLSRAREIEHSGRRVFHFEIGDSDFRAHQFIIDATKKALDDDKTHYVPSAGIPELRQAICEHTEKRLGFRPDLDQVLVMPSNAIIDCVMRVVADPGDDVVYPDPGFSTYIAVTQYTGIRKVGFPLRQENRFRMEAEQIASRLTPRTRLIIINSPNNPTGSVTPPDEIDRIAYLASREDLYLLSDEIYSEVLYDRSVHASASLLDHCRERTIILNGFAKNYAMPGWRLGYAVGPKEVIRKMTVLFETQYSCMPPFIQYGGLAALQSDPAPVRQRIRTYQVLRDLMVEKLNEIPGVECLAPEGACYVFPNITGTGLTSGEFAEFVLEHAGVALLPGTCFGANGEGYVRLCFTRSAETIETACEKIKAVISRVRRYQEVFVG
jgi:aspartate aminotransferase